MTLARPRIEQKPRRRLTVVTDDDAVPGADRPRTRGDCVDGPRPCPWVSCKYNLYLEVTGADGILIRRDCEPDEVPPEHSCALDIADRGGASLEDLGEALNVTRERARQIESKAISRVEKRARLTALRDYDEGGTKTATSERSAAFDGTPRHRDDERDERDDEAEVVVPFTFFAEVGDDDALLTDPAWDRVIAADQRIADAVWGMFARRHGIKSGHSIRSSAVQARLRQNKEIDVAKEQKTRGQMLTLTHEAFLALEKSLGRAPTTGEVFDRLGPDVGRSKENVRMALKRLEAREGLEIHNGKAKTSTAAKKAAKKTATAGLREQTSRVANRGAPMKKEPVVLTRDVSSVPIDEALRTRAAADPLLAELIKRRDSHADKVAKLTLAIEAWDS